MFRIIRYLDTGKADPVGGDIPLSEIEEIYKEVDGESDKDKDPDEGSEETKGDESQPDDDQNDEAEGKPKEKKEGKPEEESPEGEEPAKDEEGKEPADETEEAEGEESKTKEEEISKERVEAWAVKHKMTFEEAEVDLKATLAVLKNYKEPEEIARSLRSTQSELDRILNEKKQAEQEKQPPVFERIEKDKFLAEDRKVIEARADDIVDEYRTQWPEKSDLMTDKQILEEIAHKRYEVYEKWAEKQEGEVKQKATAKRDSLLNEIPAEDKQFIPLIKATLNETSDAYLMNPGFDIKHLIYHARGQKFHEAVKEARAEGIKIGRENPTIIGTKSTGSGVTKTKSTAGNSGAWAGTAEQKSRAQEAFSEYSPDEAYKMYQDTWKDELKADKHFIG